MVRRKTETVATIDQILAKLRECKTELFTKYKIKSMKIIGSYALGEQRVNSDIDLLTEFEEIPTIYQYVQLKRELESLLGIMPDIMVRDVLPKPVQRAIERLHTMIEV